MSQRVHVDVLFAILDGLMSQLKNGEVSSSEFSEQIQPIYAQLNKQLDEQNAQTRSLVSDIRREFEEYRSGTQFAYRCSRSILSEFEEFIESEDLKERFIKFSTLRHKKQLEMKKDGI